MKIKLNKKTQMWEVVDSVFGSVLYLSLCRKDCIKFKECHSYFLSRD